MVDLREDKSLRVLAGLPNVDMGVAIHKFLLDRGFVRESLSGSNHGGNRGIIVLLVVGVLVSLDTWQQWVPRDRFTVAVTSFPALRSIVDGLHDLLLLLHYTCGAIDH